jgi:hypothetical protein
MVPVGGLPCPPLWGVKLYRLRFAGQQGRGRWKGSDNGGPPRWFTKLKPRKSNELITSFDSTRVLWDWLWVEIFLELFLLTCT